MQIYAIGLHQNNVPEKLWRQAPVSPQALKQYSEMLSSLNIKKESLFINSAHSIEIFAILEGDIQTKEILKDFLLKSLKRENNQEKIPFHHLEGPDAVRHFLHLSLGVEPIGQNPENDFLENTSKSIAIATKRESAGLVLNRLYQTALMLAAKVEQSGLSFDYSFITHQIENLVVKIFGTLSAVNLMVVGTNPFSKLLLNSVETQALKKLLYVHRTSSPGPNSTEIPAGHVISPHEINDKLAVVQVVLRMNQDFPESFSAENLKKIMGLRKNQPLLIVNLDTTIMPEPSLNKLYNLFVYDLTDFQHHETQPEDGISFTRDLIENELKQFFAWFYSKEHYRFGDIIGMSKSIEHVLELIARISQTKITVLIQGDSGTGKELVARAIHENSPRHNKPFITVNCRAIPDTLLESELFGHERGSFTGATSTKKGLLEEADGGTLLLDEIGDTSPAFQVKLLRVLQEGEMRRVGSTEFQKIDVRIIAATNSRLDELVTRGEFRKDLYYRLDVVQIDLPPLRDRKEDILPLAEHFIAKYSEKIKRRVTGLAKESEELISKCPWPGNIRELENAIERAVALSIGRTIMPEDLPPQVRKTETPRNSDNDKQIITIKELEKQHITKALSHYKWDYDQAARVLGIGRTTLWRKIKEYEIERNSS